MEIRGQHVWPAIDRLVEGTTDLAGLRAHGLQLLAARRWQTMGRPLPASLQYEVWAAAIAAIAAPRFLCTVREQIKGPMLLLKGPEVASRYPDPALRPFVDLDVLVPDAGAAQQALLAAGFTPVSRAIRGESHHRVPLTFPGSPLYLEVHEGLGGLHWMTPPSIEMLVARAVPSATGVADVLTLPPADHAMLLAAHSWRHMPLRRVRDLLDIALLTDRVDPAGLAATARAWNMTRLWEATVRAGDVILGGAAPASWWERYWFHHLLALQELTSGQACVRRWIGSWWAPTPRWAIGALALALRRDLHPLPGESWPAALGRMGRSLRPVLTELAAGKECPPSEWRVEERGRG